MKLCVPIREKSQKQVIFKVFKAKKLGADMVEIWLDSILDLNLKELFCSLPLPAIAVLKTKEERGRFRGKEKERFCILKQALEAGARYIDIDLKSAQKYRSFIKKLFKGERGGGVKGKTRGTLGGVIVSFHNFNRTPDLQALLKITEKAFGLGADIAKIAVKIRKYRENVILFELASQLKNERKKAIIIGMGERGGISRVGCLSLGGFLTYAALDKNSKTASGQKTLKEMVY